MTTRFNLKSRDWIHQPDSKRQFNDALFTEVAARYALVTRALSLGRDRAWKKSLVDSLPALDCPNCLDLACGPGDITFSLARKYETGHIVGLDLCTAMLQLAHQRNRFSHVEFQQGDMGDTGLDAASIDVVTGGYALRNAPCLKQTLDEVFRVLRPGGAAAFLDFSKPSQRSLQQLEHFLLMTWGGFWGLLLHRNAEVYAYIAKSLQTYPDRPSLRKVISDCGFVDVRSRKFFCGIVEILQISKPG